jgi:hypothetical protein
VEDGMECEIFEKKYLHIKKKLYFCTRIKVEPTGIE